MSNTLRKDKHDKIFKEGIKKKSTEAHYRCDCYYCVGADKNDIVDKIAEKEMKEEIRTVETGEHIDFDIPEQDEIIGQIMGRV